HPHAVPSVCVFFFHDRATPYIYTLSLHDALPISAAGAHRPLLLDEVHEDVVAERLGRGEEGPAPVHLRELLDERLQVRRGVEHRSEEHTSELQSRENLVCRLLLEKKKHRRPTLPY